MNSSFIVLISILFLHETLAQKSDSGCNYITDYYQFVYKGQLNYLKENYDSAYIYLKQAESNCQLLDNPQTNELGILVEITARKSMYDETARYMEMKLRNGYNFQFFEKDSVLSEFKQQKQWTELKAKSEKLYNDWYANLNLDLRKELIQMNKEDQRVRMTRPIDFNEMKKVDSINIHRLKEIFRDYGYPSQNLIGNWFLDEEHADIHTIIFHINESEDVEYFKSLFLEWVKCGKSEYPGIYANLIDSNDRRRGIFTYGIYDNVEAENIDDFENLDKRRISVGLAPWELQKEIQRLLTIKYDLPN